MLATDDTCLSARRKTVHDELCGRAVYTTFSNVLSSLMYQIKIIYFYFFYLFFIKNNFIIIIMIKDHFNVNITLIFISLYFVHLLMSICFIMIYF
jgi:hypothetical protein